MGCRERPVRPKRRALPAGPAQPLGLRPRPTVEPGDDIAGGIAGSIEWYGRLTHAGDGYARHEAGIVELLRDPAQGGREGVPQLLRVVVGPARPRVVGRSRRGGP